MYNSFEALADKKVVLQNFDNAQPGRRTYGGNAGMKASIIWQNEYWMVKFPESTAAMKGNLRSYTTSPISEWISSHIYAAAGIPVHDTVLGTMRGKVVVACRDFETAELRLNEYHDIKNMASFNELPLPDGSDSTGASMYLNDILASFKLNEFLADMPEVEDRFWDMFVVDALVGNTDRNNTNWGLLIGEDSCELAPVYDNGNSLFNKRREETDLQDLADPARMRAAAINNLVFNFLDDSSRKIHPFEYMRETTDTGCREALERFVKGFTPQTAYDLIDSLPRYALGSTVMSPDVSRFLKEIIRIRYEEMASIAGDDRDIPDDDRLRVRNQTPKAEQAAEPIGKPSTLDELMVLSQTTRISTDQTRTKDDLIR